MRPPPASPTSLVTSSFYPAHPSLCPLCTDQPFSLWFLLLQVPLMGGSKVPTLTLFHPPSSPPRGISAHLAMSPSPLHSDFSPAPPTPGSAGAARSPRLSVPSCHLEPLASSHSDAAQGPRHPLGLPWSHIPGTLSTC